MSPRLLRWLLATSLLAAAGVALADATGVIDVSLAPKAPQLVTNYGEKEPVLFDHATHLGQDLPCERCHHNASNNEFKCGDCHKKEAGEAPKMKHAAHKDKVGKCWSCHHDKKEATHPMKCKDCHKGQ